MGDLRLWTFQHRGLIPVPFLLSVVFLNAPAYPYESVLDVLLDVLGLAVIGGGLALRAWAIGHAGAQTRSYRLHSKRLATSGPYAYVRNPIYLGNFFIGLGLVLMAESWIAFVILLVVFSVEYGAIVSLEEEFLSNAFGDRYEAYRRSVPRWVPRLSPPRSQTPVPFSWRALRKEYLALLSALAMAGVVEIGEHLYRLNLR